VKQNTVSDFLSRGLQQVHPDPDESCCFTFSRLLSVSLTLCCFGWINQLLVARAVTSKPKTKKGYALACHKSKIILIRIWLPEVVPGQFTVRLIATGSARVNANRVLINIMT
jgi:hypothetical protein